MPESMIEAMFDPTPHSFKREYQYLLIDTAKGSYEVVWEITDAHQDAFNEDDLIIFRMPRHTPVHCPELFHMHTDEWSRHADNAWCPVQVNHS